MKRYLHILPVVFLLVLAVGCADEGVATPTAETAVESGTPLLTPLPTGTSVALSTSPTAAKTPQRSPLPTLGPLPPATTEQAEILEIMGKAYAQDVGLTLTRLEAGVAGTVAGDAAEWVERLDQALSLGYAPQPGTFHAVPFDAIATSSEVEMAGRRTPLKVLEDVLAPGNVVLLVKWHFSTGKPVESFAIFSAGGEPIFDTLLAMPVVNAPVFDSDHF
jgi:hypothetical protein